MTALAEALGITPTPQKRITLKLRDPKLVRDLKNKQFIKKMREIFRNADTISAKKLADILLDLMAYGVDIKDDYLITRIAGDLQTLVRLKNYIERHKKDDKK
jgi:hypothetical protein